MLAVDTVSLYVSRHQDEFRYVGDNLLLHTRRIVAADMAPDSHLTCSVVGTGYLANERRTVSRNTTETITCETRKPCDVKHLDKVSEIYLCMHFARGYMK